MSELIKNTQRFIRTTGFFGRRHVLLTGRGATALMLLFEALSKPGGRVILPATGCPSLLAAVLLTGRVPVVVDVDRNLNIDPECVEKVVEPGDIVLGAHIYGIPCAIEELERICLEKKAVLIEDVAQAVGGRLEVSEYGPGRSLGTFGRASILSFAQGKILPTSGGGAILTDDEELFRLLEEKVKGLPPRPEKLHGMSLELRDALTDAFNEARMESMGAGSRAAALWETMYENYRDIYKYRIEPSEAKEIANEIRNIGEVGRNRLMGANFYRGYMEGTGAELLEYPDGCCPFRYTFILSGHDGAEVQDCTNSIRKAGMHASNLYLPLHWLAPSKVITSGCPRAEFAGRRVINLWVDEDIPEEDATRVAEIVRTCY